MDIVKRKLILVTIGTYRVKPFHGIVLLSCRCLLDTDDEVRDRATFYVNILKEKEKALSSGYILNGWFIKVSVIKLILRKRFLRK